MEQRIYLAATTANDIVQIHVWIYYSNTHKDNPGEITVDVGDVIGSGMGTRVTTNASKIRVFLHLMREVFQDRCVTLSQHFLEEYAPLLTYLFTISHILTLFLYENAVYVCYV